MSTYRTIEPSLFDNGNLLRLGLVAQWCFVYLIGKGADDEGRFEWDPFMVLRNAFSPVDPVTLAQVSDALDALAGAEMLLRYSDGKCGFLTGWFEHQRIAKAYRVESKLPRPPVPVATWAEAEDAKAAYCKETGADPQRSSYRNAVRWVSQGSLPESRQVLQESRKTPMENPLGNPSPRSKGEVEGKGSTTTPPQLTASADADKPRGGEHAALTDRAWAALGIPGKPDGKLYGFTGKRKKGVGLRLFGEWVDYLESAGPLEPFDPTADEVDWFQRAFNYAMGCKPGQGWRKPSGTNGPLHAEPSPPPGWPLRFAAEDLVSQFTDDEIAELARAPDGDWYKFPWHNVNGTQQQRAERARRAYNREQASG